ncbi:ABC transporter ATP-binding protein [Thalassorhabdus alkalitolerans]|uniref:ABC transporter ATP-binding protein n=1 Tax=Thalassorhabdus alkalitolerans TaxID=2282697 RepID=A0ABW0YIH4_9BACI
MANKKVIDLKDIWISYPESSNFSMKNLLRLRKDEVFWAVKGLNFEIYKGEVLGIIGRNGSGKSTLLKLLSGLILPDKGEYKVYGKRPVLLTLGAGFDAELSGIDNIYLNALYLGHKKKDVDRDLKEIIEYSELGDFVYKPVRTYSSGMKARLAFSIAVTLDPEVLLIDEVLGVGDQQFKDKSKATIMDKIQQKRTVIMVTHSANLVKDICDRVVWIHKGEQMEVGPPEEVVPKYLEFMKGNKK